MKTSNRNPSHFQRGSGCYVCSSCGKRTRSTGRGDNEHAGVCATCYDEGGMENDHSDQGHPTFHEDCPTCRALRAVV